MMILMCVMLAFLCGLFARRVIDLMTTLVKNVRRIRLEIDLGDDCALTAQQQIGVNGAMQHSLETKDTKRNQIESKESDAGT
jgi:hypothetical protein